MRAIQISVTNNSLTSYLFLERMKYEPAADNITKPTIVAGTA